MKVSKDKFTIYSIAEEGLLSSESIGEGRLLPALVIDVNSNKNIEDLIKIHKTITAGDVIMTWNLDFYNRNLFILKMQFTKPMEIVFGIDFKIDTDYSLIDGIIESKGFYLQTGVKGDKVSKKTNDPKILVEVPDMGVKELWNRLLLKTVKKNFRKKGYAKKESIKSAKEHIQEMRKIWKMRR